MLNWKYNVNDEIKNDRVNGIIVDKELKERIDYKGHNIRTKIYHILCNKCGYTYTKPEVHVCNSGCPCCSNKVVVRGINDIGTTHPDKLMYFENKDDAYTHTYGTQDYAWFICPICATRKYMSIACFIQNGICCQNCSDGISYPEKFIANMLMQLNIDFIRQYSKANAQWIGNKFYDFYLPEYNMIIEVNGMQHYKQSFAMSSYEDQIKTDTEKKNVALLNGIDFYIEIDARYSEMNYIKESVLKNPISKIIDLSKVKWEDCNEAACNSLVKEVCDYWRSKKQEPTTKELEKLFNLNRTTISAYLKKGTINGWCNYDPKEEWIKTTKKNIGRKKVDNETLNNIYEDWNNGLGTEALHEKYDLSCTTLKIYLTEGNKNGLCNYSVKESKRRGSLAHAKKYSKQVNVYKNGVFLMSEINARVLAEESLEKLGVKLCRSNISAVCARERSHHHGFVFRYDYDDEFKSI